MSEDSFITTYNERNNFNVNRTVIDLYENCLKLQKDVTNLRKLNIELEGELVQHKNLKSAVDRKYQRALQDIEHYKIKKLIERETLNNSFDESMEVENENIYLCKEENIKKYLDIELKNGKLEQDYKILEAKYFDLELELENCKIKFDNLHESNDDLKRFVENKKEELLEISQLKLKISELEQSLTGLDKMETNIYSSFNKVDELQVKCFKLENENKKYRENHMNLLLLMEENTSLLNQLERLDERLVKYEGHAVNSQLNDSFNESNFGVDESMLRKLRHLEKENEILKSQQMQLVEQNSNALGRANATENKVKLLQQAEIIRQGLLEQKQEQIEMLTTESAGLSKECETYKKILFQFAEQSDNATNCSEMLSALNVLYDSLEMSNSFIEHKQQKLDELTAMAMLRLEQYEITDDVVTAAENSADQKMILELRQQVEYLHKEMEEKAQIIAKLQKSVNSVETTSANCDPDQWDVQPHHYTEMGFRKDSGITFENERNRNIFRKLSNELLMAVRKVIGYSLELGPTGYLAIQSCFDDDPSHVLEFQVHEEPVLLENAYSLTLTSQRNLKESFPALLADITLDLVKQKENLMS